jgi:glycosyltransferase involved in cell wall biosynthesis
LRFCLLTTFYPPWHFGGDAIQVRRLAHALADRGHAVTVVHSPLAHRLLADRRPSTPPEHPGVERIELRETAASLVGTFAAGRPLRARGQLEAILARDFDVIHFHNPSLLGAPAVMGMGDAVKLYTAHEQWLLCPSHVLWQRRGRVCERPPCRTCELTHGRPPQLWRRTGLIERSLEHVDALILPSRASARLHERFAPHVRLEVLDHFVPDADSSGAADPAGAAGSERPYFLYAGRLEPIKGVGALIDAFGRRGAEDLLIAGEGGRERRLRRRAAGMPHVRFEGWLDEDRLARAYDDALAVAVPTLGHEAFSLAPVEGFAHGTPAVVHRFGALADLADETGAALTYGSPPELDAALERIAGDGDLRADLGRRARDAYEQRFTLSAHLRRYFSLIAELARGRGSAELAAAAEGAAGVGAAAR